jgi:hypothetical protein
MFQNWLNGIDKITKGRIHIGVLALCWSIWKWRNKINFNKIGGTFFSGYLYGFLLDPAVVLSAPRGSAGTNGYWMQPSANGRTGYLHSGWMAVC